MKEPERIPLNPNPKTKKEPKRIPLPPLDPNKYIDYPFIKDEDKDNKKSN